MLIKLTPPSPKIPGEGPGMSSNVSNIVPDTNLTLSDINRTVLIRNL